jgi:hypothetical protein
MWFQILDTFIIILFILFLVTIFRGYHLSKYDNENNDTNGDGD